MNYRQRRNKAGLTAYVVAKELGINYYTFVEVDRGLRDLEGEYVDKFLKVLERAPELRFQHTPKMVEVDNFFTSNEARKTMKKYGYNMKELSDASGVSYVCCNFAFNLKFDNVSQDKREMIYDFLHNPLNKKINGQARNSQVQYNVPSEPVEQETKLEDVPVECGISTTMACNENIEVKELQEENKSLKKQIELYEQMFGAMTSLIEENKKLKYNQNYNRYNNYNNQYNQNRYNRFKQNAIEDRYNNKEN